MWSLTRLRYPKERGSNDLDYFLTRSSIYRFLYSSNLILRVVFGLGSVPEVNLISRFFVPDKVDYGLMFGSCRSETEGGSPES